MNNITEITVRGYHLDVFSHVNNARYLEFLEEARWNAMDDISLGKVLLDKGLGFAVVNINISYRFPAGLGARLEVVTTFKKSGTKSVTLNQLIRLKGTTTVVVDADVTFVFIDLKSGRAAELDDELKNAMLIGG